ncbi:uncharacterized protein F4822DRAFT_406842 [Hypoxylon trugodes]|uniref:uncharacterized protein n=1 Tax=Hypoxylon trugodes TaxID=326681 RepID=UPI00219F7FD4|nr:uncharacterized protein F4822DRAFT_406842 [Hypoxylon trugodes]KAI1387537.1 hypothetical protein F4822DRAFT_406842 [Hypoxylon trugodes]
MVSSPNAGGIYGLAAVFFVVAAAAVALRYQARRIRAAGWKADDWFITAAMLLTWGLGIILIYGTTQGTISYHTTTDPVTGAVIVTPHENQISMFGGISQILTVIALGTLKFGVVMFYRRIFANQRFYNISLGILILITAWTVAFFFATLFECNGQNLDLLWKSIKTFKEVCYKYKNIQLAHCITDIATDLIVLSMPLPEIWKLRMSIKQKIVISLIFLIGLLSTAAGTARLVIVAIDIVETTPGARDVRGVETNVLVWSYVEVGVGVVAACLPTLKPIFDNRSLNSIVASARSKVSLRSNNSGSRNRSNGDRAPDGSSGLELFPYDASKQIHNYSQISGAESTHPMPTYPAKTILREDGWTVQSESRADHTRAESSVSAGSKDKDMV